VLLSTGAACGHRAARPPRPVAGGALLATG
jgi:hypothetical protein